MTILGIIATIMITTLKPAEYKDKGLAILAKKVLSEIDTATTQILINNSMDGTMGYLYLPNSSATFGFGGDSVNSAKLYKRYLTATRQVVSNSSHCKTNNSTAFYLKDGACVGILAGSPFHHMPAPTIFPGEVQATNLTVYSSSTPTFVLGLLYVDTNGDEEPNVLGKDMFTFPVGDNGIIYADD